MLLRHKGAAVAFAYSAKRPSLRMHTRCLPLAERRQAGLCSALMPGPAMTKEAGAQGWALHALVRASPSAASQAAPLCFAAAATLNTALCSPPPQGMLQLLQLDHAPTQSLGGGFTGVGLTRGGSLRMLGDGDGDGDGDRRGGSAQDELQGGRTLSTYEPQLPASKYLQTASVPCFHFTRPPMPPPHCWTVQPSSVVARHTSCVK